MLLPAFTLLIRKFLAAGWQERENMVKKEIYLTPQTPQTSPTMFRIILIMLFPAIAFAQGPLDGYLKGKGVLDLAPSFSFNHAEKFAAADGILYSERYKGQMLSLFAEYGLSKKLDLVAIAAAVFTQQQSGLQDGGLFAKYRPVYTRLGNAGKLGVLLGTGLSFPLSDYEPGVTGALGQRAIIAPAKILLQWESPFGLFLNITGGYHFRFDKLKNADIARIRKQRPDYEPLEPQDFTTLLLKLGFPARHFYLDGWVEWQHTSGGANYIQNVPDLPQSYGVSYTQIGGTAYYSDNGRNGFYCSAGYILGGRNTSLIRRITFGAVLKFGN